MTPSSDDASLDPIVVAPRRRWPSKVWVIPLVAALIGLSLVVQAISERGPTIRVTFATAEGIEAGKTKIKYRDVDIGEVRTLHLAEDRSKVQVEIELAHEARSFAVSDSRFWVVRPRLAGTGISGLETLLSGAYIAVDGGRSTDKRTDFAGLDTPPPVTSDSPGRRFRLNAADLGSLDVGSPVFFRRIAVGHVESVTLEPDGRGLSLGIFIKAPYDRFVTQATRFWHASGIDISLDASGIKLNTQSLASILLGGVAFETPGGSEGEPVVEGRDFALSANRAEATKGPDGEAVPLRLRFHQSVRGLTSGAPVDFRGVELGQVRSIGLAFDRDAGDFVADVTIEIFPDRLGSAGPNASQSDRRDQQKALVARMVARGLRAQLRTGSMLTGQLYVALDFFPAASPVRFDVNAETVELPTVPSDFQELYQQLQAILAKLDKVPFDTLGRDLHQALASLDQTLRRADATLARTHADLLPEMQATLRDLRGGLAQMQANLAGDAPLQQDTRQAMRSMTDAARSLKRLTDSLERQPESLVRGRKEQDK